MTAFKYPLWIFFLDFFKFNSIPFRFFPGDIVDDVKLYAYTVCHCDGETDHPEFKYRLNV